VFHSVEAMDDQYLCKGCLREPLEIVLWPTLTPLEQWIILAKIKERRRGR
jgi:predicted Fe-S protein YdhL (DUF1289 family)